jgi:hypothetical protein
VGTRFDFVGLRWFRQRIFDVRRPPKLSLVMPRGRISTRLFFLCCRELGWAGAGRRKLGPGSSFSLAQT